MKKQQELILLRGIPGAGKSTFGETLRSAGFHYFEADQWRDGGRSGRLYNYDWNDVAHGWCFGMTCNYLRNGGNVAVGNVFAELSKMLPYYLLAQNLRADGHTIKFTVLHVEGPKGRSVHEGVDYEKYLSQWQPYNGEFDFG